MQRLRKARQDESQLRLAFAEEARAAVQPVFFAFLLEEAAQEAAAIGRHLNDELALHGALRPEGQLHISLIALPSGDERTIDLARKAAQSLKEKRFKIFYNCAMSFDGGRSLRPGEKTPFVLGGDEDGLRDLMDFHRRLGEALERQGLRVSIGRFTPHTTLLYSHASIARTPIDMLQWTVRELVLVRSLWGESRYDRLGAWTLRE